MSHLRRMILLTVCGLMLVPAASAQPQTFVFAERDSALRLDVWRPATPRPDSACVVSLFGGGFKEGSRHGKHQLAVADSLTRRGFTVVCIDYRLGLADSARVASTRRSVGALLGLFQWCIDLAAEDCAEACAWLVAHASELGISPRCMVLTGCSAGAITVVQMDYYRANANPIVSALPQGWRPAAVVPYSGAILGKGKPRWVTPPAPTLFMHGTTDRVVAYTHFPPLLRYRLRGSSDLFNLMKDQGFPAWIIRFEGLGHEVASWLPGSVDLFCAFADHALAGRASTLDATMTDRDLQPSHWSKMTLIDLYKK